MKKVLYLGILVSGLISCSSNDRIDSDNFNATLSPDQFPQKWELRQMSGNIANVPPTTGNDMEWQEYYVLNEDQTFIKSRERDRVVTEEQGSFNLVTTDEGVYLELTYDSANDLIGNCSSEATETLLVTSTNELIGTWQYCDGPGLIYERVE